MLCTRPFAPVAARDAKSGGLPSLVCLTIDQDLATIGAEDRRALAERLVDGALRALTKGT